MEIILEKQSEVNALLKVTIQEADYQEKIEKTVKEYAKTMNLKGFRPGKVPPALVKQRFGKDIKVEQVSRLMSDALDNYLKDNKVKILASPVINREKADAIDWNLNEFEFEYELGLVPDFTYKLDKDLVFDKYVVNVTQAELDETINDLRKNYAESIEAEAIAEGDFVKGILKQVEGDFEQELTLPISQLKEEFQGVYLGKTKEDEILIQDLHQILNNENGLKIWTGLKEEELANLTGQFTFKPTSIMHRELAELNQEFFDKFLGPGKATNEEEFRQEIQKQIEESYADAARNLLKREITKKLIADTDIPLPDAFLMKYIANDEKNKAISEAEVEKSYHQYKDTLKQQLIENRIADATELKVEYEELLNHTKSMFREQFSRYGLPVNDEFDSRLDGIAKGFLNENKGDNYMNMFNQVFAKKISEKMLELVSVNEKALTREAFNKMADEIYEADKQELAEQTTNEETTISEATIVEENN
ncbi:MAG: trigger factor [Verrucomicrobia bacterium]|nr:trigger factor [Cytophagales bacterium]